MRSILVGEVRTGRRITQIPVASATWSVQHRGTGEITVDIPLDADEFRVLERSWVGGLYFGQGVVVSPDTFPEAATPLWRPGDGLRPEFLAALEPGRCFMAVLEDDFVIEAGPIWTWEEPGNGMLRVKAMGLRSLFDRRRVAGPLPPGAFGAAWAKWSVTWSGLSLGTIAKRLVEFTMNESGGDLPIVFQPDETAADDANHRRTYRGSEIATVLTRLDQLMDVQNGPDIAFEPRLTANRQGVEWLLRTGTEAQQMLYQAGDDWVWDTRVPRGGVSAIRVTRDSSQMANRSWVTGSGQDEALRMARREPAQIGQPDSRDAGFPLLEIVESRPSVEEQATADRWAAGNLAATLRPMQTWACTVEARPTDSSGAFAGPQLGQWRCGDWAKVWVPDDGGLLSLLLPKGFHRTRLLGFSGGMDEMVSLTLAPVMESR